MSRNGNKNSYFRQIAMPQSTGLPVLKPARRFPTRPGEERVPAAVGNITAAQPSRTNTAHDKTESHIASFKTVAPEPAVPSENFQNRVSTIEPPSETVMSMSEPEVVDNIAVIDRQPAKNADDRDSRNLSIIGDRHEFVSPAALDSRVIQSITRGDDGSDDLEGDRFFEQTTRSASSNRESRAHVGDRQPATIHIGSIEVRVVNPAPVQQPLIQNRPQIPSPVHSLRNGAGQQTSGKLARAFRGPFGLRQE